MAMEKEKAGNMAEDEALVKVDDLTDNNDMAEAKTNRTVNSSAKRKVTYRVKDGDNLYNIARRHGITVNKLCQLNNITPKTVIHRGLVLKCS